MTPGKVLHRVVDATQREICRCDSYEQAEIICRAVSGSPEASAFSAGEARLLSSIEHLNGEVDRVRKHFQGEVAIQAQSANSLRSALRAVCPLGDACKCQLFAAEPAGKGCGFERRPVKP